MCVCVSCGPRCYGRMATGKRHPRTGTVPHSSYVHYPSEYRIVALLTAHYTQLFSSRAMRRRRLCTTRPAPAKRSAPTTGGAAIARSHTADTTRGQIGACMAVHRVAVLAAGNSCAPSSLFPLLSAGRLRWVRCGDRACESSAPPRNDHHPRCGDRYNPGHLLPHKWENAFTIDRSSWGVGPLPSA